MNRVPTFIGLISLLCFPAGADGGLYYSGETIAELPSQWRGFLVDQRLLRNIAAPARKGGPANPARERYRAEAEKLIQASRARKLSADELADLGALQIRLGEVAKAVELLRSAQRDHPTHFRIAANLGTAWQLQGDLEQALSCLQQAVRLSPGKLQKAEELHLKLVRLRRGKAVDSQELDDLFGVRFVGEDGKYDPGKLAAAQRKDLPAQAAALVQQLALWLPADGRLLWQLAELANTHGDVKAAAAMMDGCVSEFAMNAAELRRHRQCTRAAADELAKSADAQGAKTVHEGHPAAFKPRSKRPLATHLDQAPLPRVKADAVNALPWTVLNDTTVDRNYKPTFPPYLKELDGKQIALEGYMQPLGNEVDVSSFMLIEYPVGCWYCEMPEMTGIILVDLPEGKTFTYTRGLVKIVGKLSLNGNDPENFLYSITKAKVTAE